MKEYEVELLKNSDYIPMVSKKNFLTPTEAAKLLSIDRSTVYRYLARKELKARQFRGKPSSDVQILKRCLTKLRTTQSERRIEPISQRAKSILPKRL